MRANREYKNRNERSSVYWPSIEITPGRITAKADKEVIISSHSGIRGEMFTTASDNFHSG